MAEPDKDPIESKLEPEDKKTAREIAEPPAPVIFESIRLMGENEMSRPAVSLWWSGVAAGFGISLAILCKGLLVAVLPKAEWTPAISNFGYAIGFLVVILGRMQLFTENTITPILPLFLDPTRDNAFRTARLWAIVLCANLTGCLLAALFLSRSIALPPRQAAGLLEVAREQATTTAFEHLVWGAPAGFMIAVLVWMLPRAEGAGRFFAILIMTYMVGLGGFSHVVAGSTEAFILMWRGEANLLHVLFAEIAPTFLGNVIGGTVLFATLAYGQVKEEV
ncbi:MAG: formate/nitrite transporter family protein [Rhodoblastus sp.]|nr:formate/nitrite transporter family protein [Rhodoblastus sp.]MCB9999066.1 formate/nitrite transporter family protein [Methylobacteriaceae bacterium]MCC0002495.1 formate/nitrite transporter family protein [Methylobacteriaceae bacterium]MCC2100891.1 formate/nitrite transporter family protein [Hyphomicrobiales bacterium]MCO5086937.1 formate/nitrite transporter family protein [Methylobacteriaceae bacterium]